MKLSGPNECSKEGSASRKYPVDIFSNGPACMGGKRKQNNLIRMVINQGQAFAWKGRA